MEVQEIVFMIFGLLLGLGNLTGIALLHRSEEAKHNREHNKFMFYFLTCMFFIMGFTYAGLKGIRFIQSKLGK